MKTKKKSIFTRVLMAAGILLIAAAVSLLLIDQNSQKKYAESSRETAALLQSLIPEAHGGMYTGGTIVEMPVMEIGGTDFVGILEVPSYNVLLPVQSDWQKKDVVCHPCRYAGSMYYGSLVIGGSMNQGQLDFLEWASLNDLIAVTDMTGLRTSYLVYDVVHTKDVSDENLTGQGADLVLFARNTYGSDYTLVLCERK